jgi:hypothetical protein
LNLHGSNPASTSTQQESRNLAEFQASSALLDPGKRRSTPVNQGRFRGRPVVVLSDRRQLPRPRVQPTTGGAVHLTFGTGDHEREEHLELRDARALLNELADAIDLADHLARLGREAERG